MFIKQVTAALLMCCVLAPYVSGSAKKTKRPYAAGEKTMRFKISSPAFVQNGYIPAKHACDGKDVSSGLRWDGVPVGAKSLAIIMDDPDALPGTWVHWVFFDIPPEPAGLDEAVPREEAFADGSRQGLAWGVSEDEFSRIGCYGPLPAARQAPPLPL